MKFAYFEVRPCIERDGFVDSYSNESDYHDEIRKMSGDRRQDYETFWTVYGRFPDGDGVYLAMAIGDFATKEAAHEVMSALPKFHKDEVDAALCIWEAMLEMRNEIDGLDHAWKTHGTCSMRESAADLGCTAEAAWLELSEDDRDDICAPFDWCFVPAFLRLVRFHKNGGNEIDGTPRQIAEYIRNSLAAKRRHHEPLPSPSPVRQVLDISTAHLSPNARAWLSECSTMNHAANYHGVGKGGSISTLGATMNGWFMHAPQIEVDGTEITVTESAIHDDLLPIVVHARSVGCDFINFDSDAEIIKELMVFNEEDSL